MARASNGVGDARREMVPLNFRVGRTLVAKQSTVDLSAPKFQFSWRRLASVGEKSPGGAAWGAECSRRFRAPVALSRCLVGSEKQYEATVSCSTAL